VAERAQPWPRVRSGGTVFGAAMGGGSAAAMADIARLWDAVKAEAEASPAHHLN
jgi:hypothetical protein